MPSGAVCWTTSSARPGAPVRSHHDVERAGPAPRAAPSDTSLRESGPAPGFGPIGRAIEDMDVETTLLAEERREQPDRAGAGARAGVSVPTRRAGRSARCDPTPSRRHLVGSTSTPIRCRARDRGGA